MFESVRNPFHQAGFGLVERLRITHLRDQYEGSRDLGMLSRYEAEIAAVKRDPERFDCGHFLLRKTGGS